MLRRWIVLAALAFTFGGPAFAQNVRYPQPRYLGKRASDPATCSVAIPQWYFNTVSSVFKYCSATNTWTTMPGTSSTDTLSNKTLTNPGVTAQTLTDAATVAWNANSGSIATVTIAGSRTIGAPTNLKTGGSYALRVIQGGAGANTLVWNAVFKWGSAIAPTLSTSVGAVDLVTCISFDGANLTCSYVLDIQ